MRSGIVIKLQRMLSQIARASVLLGTCIFLTVSCASFTDSDSTSPTPQTQKGPSENPASPGNGVPGEDPSLPLNPLPVVETSILALEIKSLMLTDTGDTGQSGDLYAVVIVRDSSQRPALITTFNLLGKNASDNDGRWEMSDGTPREFESLLDFKKEDVSKSKLIARTIPLSPELMAVASTEVQIVVIDRDGNTGRHDNVMMDRTLILPYELVSNHLGNNTGNVTLLYEGYTFESSKSESFSMTLALRSATLGTLFTSQVTQQTMSVQNRNAEMYALLPPLSKDIPSFFSDHAQWYFSYFAPKALNKLPVMYREK